MHISDSRRLAELGMKKAHNESVLLCAILSNDPDTMSEDEAVWAFLQLWALAKQIVETGTAEHVSAVRGERKP